MLHSNDVIEKNMVLRAEGGGVREETAFLRSRSAEVRALLGKRAERMNGRYGR